MQIVKFLYHGMLHSEQKNIYYIEKTKAMAAVAAAIAAAMAVVETVVSLIVQMVVQL